MIHARVARLTAPVAPPREQPPREPTAEQFLARWARESVAPAAGVGDSPQPSLTSDDLAAVARYVSPLFGDRPLGGLTFGELAGLPALLESHGFDAEVSRAACRALGSAIRSELRTWPDTRH